MPPGNGTGVNISVGVNSAPAVKGIAGVSQSVTKLASTAKNLFGPQSAQQVQNYTRHLAQLERQYDRVTMKVKTLQGAQAQLLAEERRARASGNTADLKAATRAVTINQNAILRAQARQMGAQANLNYAQQNRPGIGGGGGGIAQFLSSQFQNVAGGVGGAFLKALGFAEVLKGGAAIASKVFMTAVDEQKLLADLLPRHPSSSGIGSGTKVKGLMNGIRNVGMDLGYSGIETLKLMSTMGPGSGGMTALKADTRTSMQMARAFGIDAGGQASMLAEGGKLGAFVPGQARRFAEMLAREISVTGLGPRATEVQEATLSLIHNQVAMSGTASPASAMAMQTVLAKSGIAGLQGQNGASLISHMNQAFGGATDDPTIAFQEAMLRDQRGVRGYYNMRRSKEMISAGKDPRYIPDAIHEAYQLSPRADAAKDLLSKVLNVPMILLDEMDKRHKGGLQGYSAREFTATMRDLKKSGGFLDPHAAATMGLTGNQIRKGEATVASVMGKAGTPMVQGIGTLVDKATTMIQHLMQIEENTGGITGVLVGNVYKRDHLFPGMPPQVKKHTGPFQYEGGRGLGGYAISPSGKVVPTDVMGRPILPPPPAPKRRGGPPVLPSANGASPQGTQRSAADGEHLHLHVHYDHNGTIHPHVKLAFEGMVADALARIQHRAVHGDLHHRYSRVG